MSAVVLRALRPEEQRRFRLARMAAVESVPYYAHALFAVAPVAAEGLGTFAVDRQWRLYLDPVVLAGDSGWTMPQTAGVLVHEVNHLLRSHAARADDVAVAVDRLRWNYAADAEINDDLLAAGIELPEGVVTPQGIGCDPGDTAEVYYRALADQPAFSEAAPMTADSGGGCGSGSGDRPAPWEGSPGVTVAGERGLSPIQGDLVRKETARVVAASGRGSVPAGLARWAQGVLSPPTLPWTRILAATVRRAVSHQAGMVSRTFARPSRRSLPDVLMPGWRAPKVAVDVVIDTSGSMSAADLAAALAEVSGVLKALAVGTVRVGCCDAAATELRPVASMRR